MMRRREIVPQATRWSHGQAPSRALSPGWSQEHCVRHLCFSRSPLLKSPLLLPELYTDPKSHGGSADILVGESFVGLPRRPSCRRSIARLPRKWILRQGRGPGLLAVGRVPSRGATDSVLTRKGIRTSSWNHESHEMARKTGGLGGVEPCPQQVRGLGLLQVFFRASFSCYYSHCYSSESSCAGRAGPGLRSADFQSAVAPNCIRPAGRQFKALGNCPSLADCKSALRQNAILRYFGSGCATPSISSVSWLLNCPFEVHTISLFSSEPPPHLSMNLPLERRHSCRLNLSQAAATGMSPLRGSWPQCAVREPLRLPLNQAGGASVLASLSDAWPRLAGTLAPPAWFRGSKRELVGEILSPARAQRGCKMVPNGAKWCSEVCLPPLIQGFRGGPFNIQVGRAFPRAGLCRHRREEVGLDLLTRSCLVMFGHVWSLLPGRAKAGLISVCLGSGFHVRASSPLCRRARPRKRRQNPPNSAKLRQTPPFQWQDDRRLGIWLLCVSI